MKKRPTDTFDGKEDVHVLPNVLNVSNLVGWIVVPVLCAGIILAYRMIRKKTPPAVKPPVKPEKPETDEETSRPDVALQAERKKLIDAYCGICKELDAYRDREVYRELFSRVGMFIQLLLGSRRRWLAEGNPEELLQSLDTLVSNLRLTETLTAEGFQIEHIPSQYNEEDLRRACEKAELSAIRSDLEKQKRWLQQYRSFLDCKSILNDCAFVLHLIVTDVRQQDAQACFEKVQKLEQFLESRGCYAIFWEDSRTAASEAIRVDFREDHPWSTELPGLYTKNAAGIYQRIGTLGGTVRRG